MSETKRGGQTVDKDDWVKKRFHGKTRADVLRAITAFQSNPDEKVTLKDRTDIKNACRFVCAFLHDTENLSIVALCSSIGVPPRASSSHVHMLARVLTHRSRTHYWT